MFGKRANKVLHNHNKRHFSYNISRDLEFFLCPYDHQINVRSEPDFYGASTLVSEYIGINSPPKSFSSWSHGVHFKDLKYPSQVDWSKGWKKSRLVANNRIKEFLEGHGVQCVEAVGLPIIYVPTSNVPRRRKSVLIMLAHSLPSTRADNDVNRFVEYALELQLQGNYVCFCVHSDCYLQNNITLELDKRNIDWFIGSSVADAYSLKRMRNVFEYFETVCSNVIGSHFFYAQLFGAKFYFSEPFHEYKAEQFRNDPLLKNDTIRLDFGIKQTTKRMLYEKYPDYISSNQNAICNRELAEEACGLSHKVEPGALANLLGWGVASQLTCPLPYYTSKLAHKLINKIQGIS